MLHSCWRTSSRLWQLRLFQTVVTGNSVLLIWKRNMDSPIKFINCICIVTRDRSWEVKLFICFLKKTSGKFLNLVLHYLPVFWLQLSSAFAIIFAECRGLCVHLRASWYTALFRVSLLGVGLRCVGLAQKISARCKRASNTGSYLFSFFFICIFIHLLALSYMYVFFYALSAFPRIRK